MGGEQGYTGSRAPRARRRRRSRPRRGAAARTGRARAVAGVGADRGRGRRASAASPAGRGARHPRGRAPLGGREKPPLAVACALELARSGARVAFVGHAYRARPGRARVVAPGDRIDEVGDEALIAASELAAHGILVVVAPTRAGAVALAACRSNVIVVDGVLQSEPRASPSLLAV